MFNGLMKWQPNVHLPVGKISSRKSKKRYSVGISSFCLIFHYSQFNNIKQKLAEKKAKEENKAAKKANWEDWRENKRQANEAARAQRKEEKKERKAAAKALKAFKKVIDNPFITLNYNLILGTT